MSTLLKIYFQMNLFLVASYFLYFVCSRVVTVTKTALDYGQLLRAAQVLILLSLLIPVVFHFIPNKQLPALSFSNFRPFSEGINGQKKKQSGNQITSIIFESQEEEKLNWNQRVSAWMRQNESSTAIYSTLLLWLAGFCCMSLRLIKNIKSLVKLTNSSSHIRVVGAVNVVVSDNVSVPFSARFLKKCWIVLPISILGQKHDSNLAIKHEIQHHRQHDTLWAFLIEGFLCLFYINPAIYLWKKQIIEFQEFSCDEALVGRKQFSAQDYGSCLIRVAETALRARQMYVGTACMATHSKNPFYFKSFLQRRIEMLVQHRRSRHRWLATGLGTVVVLLSIVAAYGTEKTMRGHEITQNPGAVVVDQDIQAIVDKILNEAVKSQHADSGFAVIAEPSTGRILAIANVDTKVKRSKYWSLSQELQPASIAKGLVAAEALEKELTTRFEKHNCENGNYKFGSQTYHDWKKEGWPSLTTEEAITNSSDICTMKIGEKIGAVGLVSMLKDFGFGPNGTASSFPEAASGQIPRPENSPYSKIIPGVSFGFGYRITPIEMVQAYGAIANGGSLMEPVGARDVGGKVIRQVLSKGSSDETKEILKQVVLKGTGDLAQSHFYSTAGKTASSFFPDQTQGGPYQNMKHANLAGFIGFAPFEKPRIEVYVTIVHPESTSGAHGRTHAAPVFREIVDQVLKHLDIPPDKTGT